MSREEFERAFLAELDCILELLDETRRETRREIEETRSIYQRIATSTGQIIAKLRSFVRTIRRLRL